MVSRLDVGRNPSFFSIFHVCVRAVLVSKTEESQLLYFMFISGLFNSREKKEGQFPYFMSMPRLYYTSLKKK